MTVATTTAYLYCNTTSTIQIIRVEDTPQGYLERTVLPQQRICFEAPPTAYLDVQSAVFSSILTPERIRCAELQPLVQESYPVAA